MPGPGFNESHIKAGFEGSDYLLIRRKNVPSFLIVVKLSTSYRYSYQVKLLMNEQLRLVVELRRKCKELEQGTVYILMSLNN